MIPHKQKVLLPTLKERQRYIVFECITAHTPVHFKDVYDDILMQVQSMLGIFDGAAAGLAPVKYHDAKMRGIIRVTHTSVDKVKTCLGLIHAAGPAGRTVPVTIKTIAVSGIAQRAKEKMDG